MKFLLIEWQVIIMSNNILARNHLQLQEKPEGSPERVSCSHCHAKLGLGFVKGRNDEDKFCSYSCKMNFYE